MKQLQEVRRLQQLAGILTENGVEQKIHNNPKTEKAFEELVAALKADPKAAEELSRELEASLEEDTKYADYTDETPRPISSKEYWTRKLTTVGLSAAVAGTLGVLIAGGIKAEDALQMALAAATGGGAIGSTLISTVGKVKNNP